MNKTDAIWTPRFLLVLLFTFFSMAAAMMTYPLVAKFSLTLNPDLTLASTIAGLMSLMSLFVCPFAGVLSDRFSKKTILQVSSVCYGIVLIRHSFVTSIPMLIALRLLIGIFFSINNVTAVAFSTEFIPSHRMGEGLGYAALSSVLAQAVGPALGLRLVEKGGYSLVFICAAVSIFLCAAVITFLPGKKPDTDGAVKRKITLDSLMAVEFTGFMLLAALFSAGSGLISTYLAIIGDERHIANIAIYFTIHSIIMVARKPITGRLLDKKGVYFLVVPAVLLTSIGMAVLGFSYTLTAVMAASVIIAVGQGAGVPSLQADVIKKLDKSRTGVATSTIQIGQNIGNAVAPMMGSFFVKAFGYDRTFSGFGVLLTVLGWLILFLHYRREKKDSVS